MSRDEFKDMIFGILNNNDQTIKDIEVDDKRDCFQITCEDKSEFLLIIHDIQKR